MNPTFDKLIETVESARDDLEKAYNGNKAAGTRVRKIMQEVKKLAQEVRKDIMDVRNTSD
ncbi:histone H1 [Planctomycetota bacterium]